jgi:site-specific DNA recombinase
MGGNVPLGYEPDGRTLKIVETKPGPFEPCSTSICEHGSIKAVKQQADRMGLRRRGEAKEGKPSECRSALAIDGEQTGRTLRADLGTGHGRKGRNELAFERGHIHHILTNPDLCRSHSPSQPDL